MVDRPSNFDVKENVRNYYGEELKQTTDLKTNACCSIDEIPGYVNDILPQIHDEVKAKYYGCGTAFPDGLEGLTVLDVGCGSGRDVFILSKLVGERGFVFGIDMTDQQIGIAQQYADFHTSQFGYNKSNTSFIHDYMEKMDTHIKPGSLDMVTSNCVLNLAEDKDLVLQKIYHLLKDGGEMYFSDVYANRRLTENQRRHKILWGECLGGTLYENDFIRIARRIGFKDPRMVSRSEIEITDEKILNLVGNTKFFSVTYRLWKLNALEDACEDFGHVAIYRGGYPGSEHQFKLDADHLFEKNRPERVCGNTALMLSETRLKTYFEVIGGFEHHFGLFEACGTAAASENSKVDTSSCAC